MLVRGVEPLTCGLPIPHAGEVGPPIARETVRSSLHRQDLILAGAYSEVSSVVVRATRYG